MTNATRANRSAHGIAIELDQPVFGRQAPASGIHIQNHGDSEIAVQPGCARAQVKLTVDLPVQLEIGGVHIHVAVNLPVAGQA